MSQWVPIPLSSKLFLNVQEAVLTSGAAALENGFINELGGVSRFPGLVDFSTLDGSANTYLHEWHGDLLAVSSSRVWRVGEDGTAVEATDVPVSGVGRVTFARTPDEVVMAAGGPIIRLADAKTEILSPDAPHSTHVGYISGYLVASEVNTGQFYNSRANAFRVWDPIDVNAADSMPDLLNALIVTPFQEMLLSGLDSVEQYDKLPPGSASPFALRWSVGAGVYAPYTLTFADNTGWCVNRNRELVRISAQSSQPISDDIGRNVLEPADNWAGAWATEVIIIGQKLILLQLPEATNTYGSKGITMLYDYRQRKWFSLFGWDAKAGSPAGWPGCSYYQKWGRHFVGGKGKIYELKASAYSNSGAVQRVLWRSGNMDIGDVRIDNLALRVKRGITGSNSSRPLISVRVNLGGKVGWTKWRRQELGLAGEREAWVDFGMFGCSTTPQIEIDMTDASEFEVIKAKASVTPLNHQ